MDSFKDFHALKPLRESLKNQHEARQAANAERVRQQKLKLREEHLFRHIIGDVTPLKSSNKIAHVPRHAPEPAPFPRRTSIHHFTSTDDILKASLSDAYSIENLTGNDGHTRFARRGIGNDVFTKLQRGYWPVRQQLDLHGLRSDEARDTLAEFLAMAHQRGWRCVRVIHGKGYGSLNQEPVLKGKVRDWLAQYYAVVAFCQASEVDGGAGALVVLLQSKSKR